MKMEKSEQNFVKKKKKLTKGQASLPEKKNVSVDNGSQAEVKIETKSKKVDVIVIDIDGESLDESEQKEKTKKRKIVTESLNGSCVKNGNDKEVKKKKKLEIAPLSSVKEKVEEKPRKVNKIQNKSVQTKPQNVKMEKEQKEELPKRAKKRKTILVVNTEKSEDQVKEKKKQESCEGITVTKKRKSAKVTENGVKLGTPERDTCEVKVKKEANAKEKQNKLATPQMKGNKRSKAASGQKVEKDDMPNKKRDKSTKSEIVIIDEEEPKTKPKPKTELKTNGNKEKGRKASVKVSKVEEKEPKKKKKGKSTGEEEEEPLILKCEEVEEQISKTGATDTTGKKSKKKKKSSAKVETVSFGTGAKKRKIKEEVEDQHDSHIVDVVFLSEKSGNADEVTINQERRQALQMEIDKASQPQKPDNPKGLGQWGSAQFDSSDQQQKFLRLMGGFKKGSQLAAASSDRANMALGKDAQQQLQQGLLGDFERAQSRRMDFSNRGSGLGFNAPTNKKLSIDINACRSVRFDD
ncbi:lysine-rich nucleolar protein 1 [Anarrhichthys ocellatus]|uniref:lysine-rich nucleolar protein 1 n=1 Tax=Anarrhichthys ocellatus TaxID=433405 RepID=UPI0012ED0DC1|nr:lysine-rich nucleolar protein 1 [Anarrhichthys ocellatus]